MTPAQAPDFLRPGQDWEHSRTPSQRKLQGQWPTPWWLVQAALDQCLDELPQGATVLDPSCGDGRWLAAAGLRRPDLRLLGWDLDPSAVQAAQSVLAGAGVSAELSVRDALEGVGQPIAQLVVGNPPFIRPQNLPKATRDDLWARFDVLTDKCDLYAAFVDRMLTLGGGRICVVLGDTWLSMRSYQALRDRVWREQVRGIYGLPQSSFTARVGTVLLHTAPGSSPKRGHLGPDGLRIDGPLRMVEGLLPLEEAPELPGIGTLGERVRFRMGVVCGSYKEFVHRGPPGTLDHPTCRGKQVQRFRIDCDGEYIRYDPAAMLAARPYVAPKHAGLFDVPAKVVISGASGRTLRAAVDTQRLFPLDSCYVSEPVPGVQVDPWALCGLLNSAPVNAWYGARFPKARVKAVELHGIPWPAGPLEALAEAARAGDQAAVDAAAQEAYAC